MNSDGQAEFHGVCHDGGTPGENPVVCRTAVDKVFHNGELVRRDGFSDKTYIRDYGMK